MSTSSKRTRQTTAEKTTTARRTPRKTRTIKPADIPGDSEAITPETRRQMIALAAYFRAEQRGFAPGDPVADWLDAEREIDERLGLRKDSSGKN